MFRWSHHSSIEWEEDWVWLLVGPDLCGGQPMTWIDIALFQVEEDSALLHAWTWVASLNLPHCWPLVSLSLHFQWILLSLICLEMKTVCCIRYYIALCSASQYEVKGLWGDGILDTIMFYLYLCMHYIITSLRDVSFFPRISYKDQGSA